MLDLRLFKNKSFIVLNVVFAVLFFTFAGANYLMPFYLEHVHNYSAYFSGLIITEMSVGMMITGILAGLIYAKLKGKIRYLVINGRGDSDCDQIILPDASDSGNGSRGDRIGTCPYRP